MLGCANICSYGQSEVSCTIASGPLNYYYYYYYYSGNIPYEPIWEIGRITNLYSFTHFFDDMSGDREYQNIENIVRMWRNKCCKSRGMSLKKIDVYFWRITLHYPDLQIRSSVVSYPKYVFLRRGFVPFCKGYRQLFKSLTNRALVTKV